MRSDLLCEIHSFLHLILQLSWQQYLQHWTCHYTLNDRFRLCSDSASTPTSLGLHNIWAIKSFYNLGEVGLEAELPPSLWSTEGKQFCLNILSWLHSRNLTLQLIYIHLYTNNYMNMITGEIGLLSFSHTTFTVKTKQICQPNCWRL